MPKIKRRAERPPLTKGSLLETTGAAQLFSMAVLHPSPSHPFFLGILPKKSHVISIGEMSGQLGAAWMKVMSPLGLGWIRLKYVKRRKEGETP